jgi:hypothetical protein
MEQGDNMAVAMPHCQVQAGKAATTRPELKELEKAPFPKNFRLSFVNSGRSGPEVTPNTHIPHFFVP